jgi:hypothetical protein
MSFPRGFQQSTAVAQTAVASDGTLSGTPLDGWLLGSTVTREGVLNA